MSDASTATAAETKSPVLPYDPEPEHVTKARDVLNAANVLLNKKLAALGHMQEVFGSDSKEYQTAMEQVVAAQEVCNAAAIHKSVKVLEHGVAKMAEKRDAAKALLEAAAKSGNFDELHLHAAAHKAASDAHADVSARLAARLAK